MVWMVEMEDVGVSGGIGFGAKGDLAQRTRRVK